MVNKYVPASMNLSDDNQAYSDYIGIVKNGAVVDRTLQLRLRPVSLATTSVAHTLLGHLLALSNFQISLTADVSARRSFGAVAMFVRWMHKEPPPQQHYLNGGCPDFAQTASVMFRRGMLLMNRLGVKPYEHLQGAHLKLGVEKKNHRDTESTEKCKFILIYKTIRLIPNFNIGTLKLINSPVLHPVNFR